jgi:hypothetical protein
LEAIDGWEEAWNADAPGGRNTPAKDSDNDDPADADPEIIEARIKRKIERALPEPSMRVAVLKFLAYAIEKVDEERSDAWRLRETRSYGDAVGNALREATSKVAATVIPR